MINNVNLFPYQYFITSRSDDAYLGQYIAPRQADDHINNNLFSIGPLKAIKIKSNNKIIFMKTCSELQRRVLRLQYMLV